MAIGYAVYRTTVRNAVESESRKLKAVADESRLLQTNQYYSYKSILLQTAQDGCKQLNSTAAKIPG